MIFALSAFLLWGILPIYWFWLSDVPTIEILIYRIFLTPVLLGIILLFKKDEKFTNIFCSRELLLNTIFGSITIGIAWYVFMWAVQNGYVLEASFGGFITPIITIFLAMLVYGEHQTKQKMVAITLTIISVGWLTFGYGEFPLIAFFLGMLFALYAFIKKRAHLSSLESVFWEAILMIPFVMLLIIINFDKTSIIIFYGINKTGVLLVGAGIASALPLVLYSQGVKKISLSLFGMLQYVAPTLQFVVGLIYFKEDLNVRRLIGFIIIWIAVVIFLSDDKQKMGVASTIT